MSDDSHTSATADHLDPLLARLLAHELQGYLGLMKYMRTLHKADPTQIPTLLSAVIAQLEQLLAQFQLLSAGGPPPPQHWIPVALAPLLDQTAARIRLLLPDHTVVIGVDCPADLRVRGDAHALELVFQTTLRNAVEAFEQQPPDHAGRISCTARKVASVVQITIADSGPGFPAGLLGRFGPDQPARTHGLIPGWSSKGIGRGMGLTLLVRVIAWHGGRDSFANRLNGGAAVQIELPIDDLAADTTEEETDEGGTSGLADARYGPCDFRR